VSAGGGIKTKLKILCPKKCDMQFSELAALEAWLAHVWRTLELP
jgi:hypothetical protein